MSVTATTGIITPEAVVLEFRIGGLATRTIAKVIDLLAQGALFVILMLVLVTPLSSADNQTGAVIAVSLGVFGVLVLAPALCEALWAGRTPGKAIMGLRVVTVDGGPIAVRHAMVRGLLQLVELPLGMAVVIALGNPRSQRLGDLAAGTFVINERAASTTTIPTLFSPPPGLEAYCARLDVSRLDSEQFLLLRNFLLRVTEFEVGARYALAARLAAATTQRCSPPPPPGVPPEYYLVGVCAAYQVRHDGADGPRRVAG